MDDAAVGSYADGKKPGQCWKCNGSGQVETRPKQKEFKKSGKKGPRPVTKQPCTVCKGRGTLARSAPKSDGAAPAAKRARTAMKLADLKGWIAPGPEPIAEKNIENEGYLHGEWCGALGKWRILYPRKRHRYSTDDVVTAWVAWREAHRLGMTDVLHADIGCGIGSVLLFVNWLLPSSRSIGVEAQAARVRLARRSAAFNIGMAAKPTDTSSIGSKASSGVPAEKAERVELAELLDTATDFGPTESGGAIAGKSASGTAAGTGAPPSAMPRIRIRHGDLREPEKVLPEGRRFQLVTGTPPYFMPNAGGAPADAESAACLFEARGGIEAYCDTAACLLVDATPEQQSPSSGMAGKAPAGDDAAGTAAEGASASAGDSLGLAPGPVSSSSSASKGPARASSESGRGKARKHDVPTEGGWPDRYPPIPDILPAITEPKEASASSGAGESLEASEHARRHGVQDARRHLESEQWDGSGRFIVCETALEGARVYHAAAASGLEITRRVDVVPKVGKDVLFQVFVMKRRHDAVRSDSPGPGAKPTGAKQAAAAASGQGALGTATSDLSVKMHAALPVKGRVHTSIHGEAVEVMTVRDETGARTGQYLWLLRDMGKPPFA